jgi:hypothetical protein
MLFLVGILSNSVSLNLYRPNDNAAAGNVVASVPHSATTKATFLPTKILTICVSLIALII